MSRNSREPGLWRTAWSLSVVVLLLGWYVTGSVTWGYESRWFNSRYVMHRLRDPEPASNWYTEEELSVYNGVNSSLPILLAIDGMVFDVSAKPETYGSVGPYRFFSGRDAARAYATGCFQTDLTHDLRGLTEDELAAVKGWQDFFANHKKYWHVGYVEHPPLTGDPPAPCRARQKP